MSRGLVRTRLADGLGQSRSARRHDAQSAARQHGRKTDRIDAEVLARAVERGGIPLAHVLSPHRRELRRWLGVRRALVESRADMVTTVRGLAREHGEKLPSCETEGFATKLRKRDLEPELLALVEPLLQTLETLDKQLVQVETELGRLCATEPVIALLTTAPGVGPVVAASFVSVIDEAKRFRNAHQVESYLGLVPGEDSTGGKRRLGAITKKGSSYLRAVLVQASWAILRSADRQDPLRLWAEAVQKRRGKKIAVIALARRLAGVMWAMWRDGTVYDAPVLAVANTKGVRRAVQTLEFQKDALSRAASKHSVRRFYSAREVRT